MAAVSPKCAILSECPAERMDFGRKRMTKDRITNLDVLRALAALSVCLFHFARNEFLGISEVSKILRRGHLGVDVFFVISGFIIPLSLSRSGYGFINARAFLASRFVRLYPAFLAAGLTTIFLWYLSARIPGFRGEAPSFSARQLVSNGLLLSDFTGENWLIPVFWTLAIESQFYLLIAISFPFFSSAAPALRRGCMAIWITAPLIAGSGPTVLTWTSLFAIGIVTFQWNEKQISMTEFIVVLLVAAAAHFFSRGLESAIIGILTAGTIAFVPTLRLAPLVWIGRISYSLYLIHVPFGGRVLNFAERLPDIAWIRILSVAIALALSIGTAALFFYCVERPSHQYARVMRKELLAAPNKRMGSSK